MPIYVYRYQSVEGEEVFVERRFKISEYPQKIYVREGDEVYEANLVISAHARMSHNWSVKGTDSDLPDENTRPPSGR